ncbi:alpha/beta fold hydrolase, partial [Francisellaceae bacterium]|nr:alpha/beta fold hydrolase [Francisellaceae bacterium]
MTHEIKGLEFTPMIKNGKLQTILASLIRRSKMPRYHREQVILSDGDPIFIDVSQPDDWKASDPTVVLIHGLCGCSASDYMLRMTHLFLKEGMRVVRMNLRGEGDLKKRHAKQIYHAGSSGDLKAVLEHLKLDAPESKNIVIGFSISGNILLLMLGQLGEQAKSLVKYAIAICPPADLLAGSKMINKPENHIFQRYFIKSLLALMIKRHRDFLELGQAPHFPKKIALYDFDDQYTSIQAGFKSADDYYAKCSAIHVLKDIKV